MATYKGKSVSLNKPRRIAKGETSYGKKKSVVYVKDGDRGKARDLWRSQDDYQENPRRAVDLTLGRVITAITPVQKPRLAIGHVRRGDMANPVKGAIGQLGERVIDTSKGLFTALRDAFSRESAGNIQELQSVIKSFPSVKNPTIDNAPLMAAHNTSVEGIIAANEIGGIPSPSIGISDPSNLGQFGEISLIMDPNKLDPRMNIYPTDAYTGRQPKGEVPERSDSGKRVLPPRDPYYEGWKP